MLAADLGTEELLERVVDVLAYGLGSERCRIWVREPDGTQLRPVVPPDETPPDRRPVDAIRGTEDADPVTADAERVWVRYPLVHEGELLGQLEAAFATSAPYREHARVLQIVASVLSTLLGALELSEDLASEVALRTREIEAQRMFTAKIIDSLPVGLYVIDRNYHIQAWNRKRETGTQGVVREEALGRNVFDVLHRQPHVLLKREFDRVFLTGEMEEMEVVSETSGDRRFYRLTKIPMCLEDGPVSHVITIGEDITEWKHIQHQVSQTEKLAAVGQLAAGVMHEINNPLATIGACVEAIDAKIEDVPEGERQGIEEYLRIVDAELRRCHAIVNGLLDFSRPKARVKRKANINAIVEDALFLIKHHDRFKEITLYRQLMAGLPPVEANTEQLIQVFLALMLNSIDALEGKGTLTVRTQLDPERGDEVLVVISDTGAGIADDDLPKIFEPFFTTKQPGRGTGLGLSICYGIVQEHGGRITVASQPGYGTEFAVRLPVLRESES
jgi:two-component system NtrC family sensor kinase